MLPVLYNNNYQIVQTPDTVMILVEMVHDVRVIRMNGTHAPANVRQVAGRFDRPLGRRHAGGGHHQFQPTDPVPRVVREPACDRALPARRTPNTILYRATIDDPSTFTKQWTMEYPFLATAGPVYEYACHEGNYAMTDIMGGARKMESQPK